MKLSRSLFVASALAVASLQASACYTVYDASSRVLYRSSEAPVDMSRPLHETLPRQFPGGHLVFDTASSCPSVSPPTRAAQVPRSSPLMTDRATAEAMGVPYEVLSRNIVLVQPQDATVAVAAMPALSIIPSEAPPGRAEIVITELRNPPMMIVERNGVAISERVR